MDHLDFSEKEIRQQLAVLGYRNIPKHRLLEFKKDLEEVIRCGSWKSPTSNAQINHKTQKNSQSSPPAFTKEKVSKEYFRSSEGFFLHEGRGDHEKQQLLSTHQIRSSGYQQEPQDFYAQNSVAPKLHFPTGGPTCLQVEPDVKDVTDSYVSDSDSSCSDTRQRRFIKRKVLRKHGGQSLVCDESIYSEDSARFIVMKTSPSELLEVKPFFWKEITSFLVSHILAEASVTSRGSRFSCDVLGCQLILLAPSLSPRSSLISQFLGRGVMYKMCKAEWDEESDESGSSLCSSFWSDGEQQEEEVERMAVSDPVDEAEGLFPKTSDEPTEALETPDDEVSRSSSDSAAVSLMTSGYGTWRPEEQDGGDRREEQSSQGYLSETRDEEQALDGFEEFRIRDDPDLNRTLVCMTEEEERKRQREGTPSEKLHGVAQKHQLPQTEERLRDEERLEDRVGLKEGRGSELSKEAESREEAEDPDESSSNKDIKFIDSNLDFSWTPCGQKREEQQQEKASCLEERLADLHFPAAAQGRDLEAENEASGGWSPSPRSEETDSVSTSAFESYMRTMTRARSEGDLRPKPKSFIRPVRSQQSVKKSDPVAKYFEYKQIWEMFKLPGEEDRKALRWEIRERLAYQPPPPKPRRVFVPNPYVVPTEKKRSALRWEIRNHLANSLHPHKFSSRP